NNGIGFHLATVDLRTGHEVGVDDVLAKVPADKLVACASKSNPDVQPFNGWEELAKNIELTEQGVHFFATGFPPFAVALAGTGPVVPYGVLLRDGYLRRTSPVKRAWEGASPAPKDEDFCGEWH